MENPETIQDELMAQILMTLVVGLVEGLLFRFFIALIQKIREKTYGQNNVNT